MKCLYLKCDGIRQGGGKRRRNERDASLGYSHEPASYAEWIVQKGVFNGRGAVRKRR